MNENNSCNKLLDKDLRQKRRVLVVLSGIPIPVYISTPLTNSVRPSKDYLILPKKKNLAVSLYHRESYKIGAKK